MTKEELAAKLNGREYGNEMTTEEERNARKLGCKHKRQYERLLRIVSDRNYHCSITYEKVCMDCGKPLGSSNQEQCPGVPGRRPP